MSKRLASSLIAAIALASCGEALVTTATAITTVELKAPVAKPCPTPDANRACLSDTHDIAANYQKALAGDYQAQRNTAWAFGGESPYLVADPVQACAWRKAILATRPADAAFADDAQLRIDCDKLDPEQVETADALRTQIIATLG